MDTTGIQRRDHLHPQPRRVTHTALGWVIIAVPQGRGKRPEDHADWTRAAEGPAIATELE